jgi:Holliday junction resolvase-like predicted endonuclease
MTRPYYETGCDLETENQLADIFLNSGYELRKLNPAQYAVDFAVIHRGTQSIVGFIEVKRRRVNHDLYPNFMISLSKMMKGIELAERTNTTFGIYVKYDDGWFSYNVNLDSYLIPVIGGRKDRGDEYDIEPVVKIDIKHFRNGNV